MDLAQENSPMLATPFWVAPKEYKSHQNKKQEKETNHQGDNI